MLEALRTTSVKPCNMGVTKKGHRENKVLRGVKSNLKFEKEGFRIKTTSIGQRLRIGPGQQNARRLKKAVSDKISVRHMHDLHDRPPFTRLMKGWHA